jgi:glycerophosphoryl diester phosphodiesterase
LRTTKNEVIVCFHDANLKRVVRNLDESLQSTGIEELTLSDLEQLDVGSYRGRQFAGQQVPTLAAVFADMQGRPERLLYLDVKKVDLEQLAKMVRDAHLEQQVIFTSPDHELISRWKTLVPESMTLIWNSGDEKELTRKINALRKRNFDGITHLQIHVKVADVGSDEPFSPPSAFISQLGEEMERRGIVFQVLPWECSDPRAYERLLELGVDSFATDYPEVTLGAVRSFREKLQQRADE